MKKLQKILVVLAGFGLAVFLGCSSVADVATPCYIPETALEYADSNATSILPWTTMFDAQRVQRKMDYVHAKKSVTEDLAYNFLTGANKIHLAAAQELQAKLFDPQGPIGLAFPTLMGGTLGALLIKKPGTKTKKEYEEAGNMNPSTFKKINGNA